MWTPRPARRAEFHQRGIIKASLERLRQTRLKEAEGNMSTETDNDTRLFLGLRGEQWEVIPKSRWRAFQAEGIALPEWSDATCHFVMLALDYNGCTVNLLPYRHTFDAAGHKIADDPPIWNNDELAVYRQLMQQVVIVSQTDRQILQGLTAKLFSLSLPPARQIRSLLEFAAVIINQSAAEPGLSLALELANSPENLSR